MTDSPLLLRLMCFIAVTDLHFPLIRLHMAVLSRKVSLQMQLLRSFVVRVVFVFLLTSTPVDAHAGYNLTTLVGASSAMFSGNGGPASSARIFAPLAVAYNASTRSFLVSDSSNGVVRMVLPNGTIVPFAGIGCYGCCNCGSSGDGLATAVKLNYPSGIALDGSGGAYIADKSNQ